MEKGVIALPMNINYHMTGLSFSSKITPEMVRYYMLYWDRMIVPDNNLLSFGIPDETDLMSTGRVLRPRLKFDNGRYDGQRIADAMLKEQAELAKMFNKDPKVDWHIHQSDSKQFYLPTDLSETRDQIRFGLTNVLPVPDKSVNINEILEFKDYRRDELGHLHQSIDDMYKQILSAPDQTLEGKQVISQFQQSINNLDQVTKERFKFFNKFDVDIQYKLSGKDLVQMTGLSNLGSAALPALGIDMFTGYSFSMATAVGALAGFMSGFEVSFNKNQSLKDPKINPLAYLSKASKVGIIQV
ncbi:DUF6236 family protein [Vibrio parahaemolyticus]